MPPPMTGSTFFTKFLNYCGQLRPYSYADLFIMLIWLGAGPRELTSCSFLWFGFLIYLEIEHRDAGRLRWHWSVWLSCWIVGVLVYPRWSQLLFISSAVLYSLKKRPAFGWISPVFNGLVKSALVLGLPNASVRNTSIVFVVMTLRNLIGDIRDSHKDLCEHAKTIPVLLGWTRNVPIIYPLALATTSALWVWLGRLQWYVLAFAWTVQVLTYRLTRR